MDDVSVLPLHKIAANPDHAIEHFKFLLGQVRQLNILGNADAMNQAMAKPDRLSESEKQLWRLINRQD
jgi:hypothetical protein